MRSLNSWTAAPRRLLVSRIILSDSSNILFCSTRSVFHISADGGPPFGCFGHGLRRKESAWIERTPFLISHSSPLLATSLSTFNF